MMTWKIIGIDYESVMWEFVNWTSRFTLKLRLKENKEGDCLM